MKVAGGDAGSRRMLGDRLCLDDKEPGEREKPMQSSAPHDPYLVLCQLVPRFLEGQGISQPNLEHGYGLSVVVHYKKLVLPQL